MSERQSFLAAIRRDPDADAPRLVYADWLTEHGEALKADLIRYQVAGGAPILAAHLRHPELASETMRRRPVRFERGFVEEVAVSRTDRPAELDEMFAEEAVRRVGFFSGRSRFRQWSLSQLVRGAWSIGLRAGAVAALEPADVPRCRTFRLIRDHDRHPVPTGVTFSAADGLRVTGATTGADEFARALDLLPAPPRYLQACGLEQFPDTLKTRWDERLEVLTLTAAAYQHDDFTLLAGGLPPMLTALSVHTHHPEEWLARLPRLAWVGRLERLKITSPHLWREPVAVDLAPLARATPNLRVLRLDRIAPSGVGPVFSATAWPRLEDLSLRGCSAGLIDLLMAGDLLPRLHRLELAAGVNRALQAEQLTALARSSRLGSLTLRNVADPSGVLAAYLRSGAARLLTHLHVEPFGHPPAFTELAGPDAPPDLRALSLAVARSASTERLVERWGPRTNLSWEQ